MATDYDSPRKTDDDLGEDSLQELQARRMDKSSSTIDLDPDDAAEGLELPGAGAVAVVVVEGARIPAAEIGPVLDHHRSLLPEEGTIARQRGGNRGESDAWRKDARQDEPVHRRRV